MARNYTMQTIKTLFGQAKDCAYPSCCTPLILADRGATTVVAQIAHIRSESPDGPRHDKTYTLDINGAQNLLLLCGLHHPPVDRHESLYPVQELEAWKLAQVANANGGIALTEREVRRFVRLTAEERQAIIQIARLAERVMAVCERARDAAQPVQDAREDAIVKMRRTFAGMMAVPGDGSPAFEVSPTVQLSPVEERKWQQQIDEVLNRFQPAIHEALSGLREEVAVLRMMSADLKSPAEEVRIAAVSAAHYVSNEDAHRQTVLAMEAAVRKLWMTANGEL